MSFIKSDSLLSNIKNISIKIDMRPNDGSNIFKSIFSNIQQREKSIKFQSLFDIDCDLKQGNSLIDKLTGTSQQPSTENKQKQRLHYNWIVCKNGGMSENQDSQNDDDINIQQHLQKIDRQQHQINSKKSLNSQQNNSSSVIIGNHNGFVFPSLDIGNHFYNTSQNNHQQQSYSSCNNHNNSLMLQQNSNFLYNQNNNSMSQVSLLQYNNSNGSQNNTPLNSRFLQSGLSLSSLNYLQGTSSSPSQPTQKKVKNQTKNIPKNYGKAIICYIEKYRHKVQLITDHFQIDYFALLQDLKRKKKSINTIADLRNLWSKYKYAKCMRVITYQFLRKHALSYIFDSRICTYGSHIKYRQRLCEAVASPQEFKHIKDY